MREEMMFPICGCSVQEMNFEEERFWKKEITGIQRTTFPKG